MIKFWLVTPVCMHIFSRTTAKVNDEKRGNVLRLLSGALRCVYDWLIIVIVVTPFGAIKFDLFAKV